MRPISSRHLAAAFAVAIALVLAPARLRAQGGAVVEAQQLTKQPKLAAPAAAAQLIARAYPPALRNAGVGGTVQLEFVVDASGKVEKSSVEVVASTAPALGDAAKTVAERLDFKPGEVNGTPVRAKVLLPLTFKAN